MLLEKTRMKLFGAITSIQFSTTRQNEHDFLFITTKYDSGKKQKVYLDETQMLLKLCK